jgi:nitrogen-specific signal transduction histidine kinase
VVRAETDDGPAAGREQPERTFVLDLRATHLIGAPETGHRGRAELLTAAAAELMLATLVVDSADRLRSFELVAEIAHASRRSPRLAAPRASAPGASGTSEAPAAAS